MAVPPFVDSVVVMLTGMHVPKGSAEGMYVSVELPHREFAKVLGDFADEVVQIARGVASSVDGLWNKAYVDAMSTFVSGSGADVLAQLKRGALQLADAAHETGYQIAYTVRMIIAQVVQFLFEWALTLVLAIFNPVQAAVEQTFLRALYRLILRSLLLRLMASIAAYEGLNVGLSSLMDQLVRWSLSVDGEHTRYGGQYAVQAAGFGAVQGAFAVFVPFVGSSIAGLLAKDIRKSIESVVGRGLAGGGWGRRA